MPGIELASIAKGLVMPGIAGLCSPGVRGARFELACVTQGLGTAGFQLTSVAQWLELASA